MMRSQVTSKPLTGRAVSAAVVAFFVLVIGVNAVFVTFAISTNTGVVANEPYRKGLKYNERIAADERQAELGWVVDVTLDEGEGRLVATLSDRDGKAVPGLSGIAKIGRSVTDRDDVAALLKETEPGRYEATDLHLKSGSYIANLELSDPKHSELGIVYRYRRRLWLKL